MQKPKCIRPQYGIVIICRDERHQEQVYEIRKLFRLQVSVLRMKIKVHPQVREAKIYRAARVRSMFNCESGANFIREFEIPFEDKGWKIGLVVGPSGSGKTSIGRALPCGITDIRAGWATDKPIIDCIAPGGDFNAVTSALASVGLGDVPAWLRPFHVLSNAKKFRQGCPADSEAPPLAVIDEFSSWWNRQIARNRSLQRNHGGARMAVHTAFLPLHISDGYAQIGF